jgi:hypothetical protein
MHKLSCLVLATCGITASPALAHYNMLLPAAASGKKGEPVTFTYQWGHPFEHQLFDAPKPESVVAFAPDGKVSNLMNALQKVALPAGEGKTVSGYRFDFAPPQRGDYAVVLRTPPIFLEEDGEFVQDSVKVVYHVQAQKGWDVLSQNELGPFNAVASVAWHPITRPYGLEPGMVFQAQAHALFPAEGFGGMPRVQPLPRAMVEVEQYHPMPPAKLPPDEHITRVVKTDPNGVATCTLPGSGWWGITVTHDGGTHRHEDKNLPLRQRATLWVFVDEKPK